MKKSQTSIDRRAQAQAMIATGVPVRLIAGRLNISERHVRRITDNVIIAVNPLIGTDDEPKVWKAWYWRLQSLRKVAWRFGVSHEAIRKALDSQGEVVI